MVHVCSVYVETRKAELLNRIVVKVNFSYFWGVIGGFVIWGVLSGLGGHGFDHELYKACRNKQLPPALRSEVDLISSQLLGCDFYFKKSIERED